MLEKNGKANKRKDLTVQLKATVDTKLKKRKQGTEKKELANFSNEVLAKQLVIACKIKNIKIIFTDWSKKNIESE